jgi:hypothetical protein
MTALRHGFGQHARLPLRVIAIAIAIAALVDPAWSVARPPSRKLVAIHMTAAPAVDVEQALRRELPGWEIESRDGQSHLPCGRDERCVVIADGSIDAAIQDDLAKPLALIAVTADDTPNVAVRSVSVSRAHQNAAGVARVELTGKGTEGQKSEIRVFDGAAVIGSATHQWSSASPATIDVPWWPLGTGARTLRIDTPPLEAERTTIDNQLEIGVTVAIARSPVLVFDARPSWSSTFVRRALEDDARFAVGYRTRLAPALTAGTANGRLDAAALDLASAVVIGGPDALTAADVTLLEQFVRVRGGTLILLAERSPAGPWSRLVPGRWTEHLTAKPEAVGPLSATEVLRTDEVPATASVLARSGTSASIVVAPSGRGRIVMAGAIDAWRYRDRDASAFDTFWRSLVAEAAAWGDGVQLSFDQSLAARGTRARFTLRDRRMAPVGSSTASAIARCGDAPAAVIRLWPAGAIGEFAGEVPLARSGSCRVEATIADRHAVGAIAVADKPMPGVEQTLAKLERRATASGGVVTRAGEEARVGGALSSAAPPPLVETTVHPMRAAWWLLPFAGCLSVEWWLRRRGGSA